MSHDTTLCPVRHALTVDQMLAKHERLVHWVVHRQWLGELSYAAAVQAGRLALWQAVQGYDSARGTAFSTYAVPAIQRAVWRAVREAQAPVCEQCCACVPQPAVDPEQALLDRLRDELVRLLVAQLPERLAYVIVAHYGLADAPPQSFAQLGRVLGVTRQRAQQLHREALLWLAQPSPLPGPAPLAGPQHAGRLPGLPGPTAALAAPRAAAMSTPADPSASQKRAAHPDFLPTFSLEALQPHLPLRFPVPAGLPPSPKTHYRSHYQYPGYVDLAEPTVLATLDGFEIALRLIDFSRCATTLARIYQPSARGMAPFDPVSLLLCVCLRRDLGLGWRRLAHSWPVATAPAGAPCWVSATA